MSVASIVVDTVSATTPSGERILLHVPSGTYLRLDRNASIIVDLLVEHEDEGEAAKALAARVCISVERAEVDVASVVGTLAGLRHSRSSRIRVPSADGVISTVKEWWALPVMLRLAVAKAALAVLAVEIGLRSTDVRTLSQVVRVPLAAGMTTVPKAKVDAGAEGLSLEEGRAYWATGWVLDRWVFPGTCLRRALVTSFFLRRHHPMLRLGLVGEGQTTHAWVEAEGMVFNATEVTGDFVPTGDFRHRQN